MVLSVRSMLIFLVCLLGACGGDPEEVSRETQLDALAEQYPKIDPGNIVIPPESELTRPDFDIGGYCLSQEEAGNGSFEWCLEVLGRELIALGGPR